MTHLQNYIRESVVRKCNEKWGNKPDEPLRMPAELEFIIEVLAEELDNLQQRCENLEAMCNP